MAKRNNKGFSLIEIVIAMAVLTLLLTPIIKQFAQTMRVSRQAKQQQYINEEASYSLEEAQVTPAKEYEKKYLDYVAANTEYTFATGTDTVYCILVDTSGNPYDIVDANGNKFKGPSGSDINTVMYTVESYTLGNLEIGYNNAEYDRIVTVDNLATQIRGCKNSANGNGFKIKYNMTEAELPSDQFTLTNEGCAVVRDGSGNVGIIVVEETPFVGNPNDTNLGNMQNLDYETVAMINGTATNFDDMAENALFSQAMEKLKEINYNDWEQGMLHNSNDNILLQNGYSPVINKLTKIYVEKLTDAATGKDYYQVLCDVYYKCSYSLGGETFTPTLSYNVFSQKFFTEKCPDIYFQYQPFISSSTNNGDGTYTVNYADDDYILIDNYVEDVKIYLYKPFSDAINVTDNASYSDVIAGKSDTYTYTTKAPTDADKASETAYESFLLNNAVAIHVAKANNNVKDAKIFTNLNTEDNGTNTQFFIASSTFSSFSEVKSSNASYASLNMADYDRSLILPIDADTRYDDRLRTVTVTMLPADQHANTVILSGAKGEK